MHPLAVPTATSARRPLVLLLALASLAACGGDDGGEDRDTLTACLYDTHCLEYEGDLLDVPSTDATCALSGATPLETCPDEGVLGLCTRQRDVTIRDHHYDAATLDLTRDSCIALGDSWSTP
jgi:hypothetical protein